ncbi:helix-turn-helix domain-containing protein [Ureibacillus aquaedulcis]|uniref:Helix-turn-helix domain-containing protein n=1 Tax=Ureibacillus aquaedulcis TaxID=3058421 RepID=A0ABT8GRF0_9BACL|nr:helix-turn-helix domain-containing protein [Ureibacillus sp. BA0131]MDN4493987.1 helix-turn-helix domain-containing protein [Ureibacillus sp. BA0131]
MNSKDIPYICDLLFKSFEIPVFYLNDMEEVAIKLPETFKSNALFDGIEDCLRAITYSYGETKVPVIHMTNFLECFIIFRLPASSGTIVIGPSIYEQLNKQTKINLMIDNNVSDTQQDKWFQYYENLPVASKTRFAYIGTLLYYLTSGKTLEVNELLKQSYRYQSKVAPNAQLDVLVSKQRESTFFHHDPSLEKNVYYLVKIGKKDEALKAYMSLPKESIGNLSKRSYLRSRKNFAISAVTLWTRAAIDGGLYYETAYTLSDIHIQYIEELEQISEVENAIINALLDFADFERREKDKFISKMVLSCQDYIFKHLYTKITLEKLGKHTGVNPSYLSHSFMKEMGIPVSEYIQVQRIEEAKKLLLHATYTVSEISSLLNFNDQSYFTKIFKKHTGMTPRQFSQSQEFKILS